MRYNTFGMLAWMFVSTALVTYGQTECNEAQTVPRSNVAGKKLIRVGREVREFARTSGVFTSMAKLDLANKVKIWQQTGLDGLCFNIATHKNPDLPGSMHGQWWNTAYTRTYEELLPDIRAFQAVQNWGRLTDNFLWSSMAVWNANGFPTCVSQDWFNDEHWKVLLGNVRLQARAARECGFKGILLDTEQYAHQSTRGPWYFPFNYSKYADGYYKRGPEAEPYSFDECAEKVRERARQYAEAISEEFPDITLFVIDGLYGSTFRDAARNHEPNAPLAELHSGLYPAFVDGLLLGLDERATLVAGCEATYGDSQYKDMLAHRDAAMEQGLILSKYPELARKRISFSVGTWTDSGWGKDRFSDTDVRANQRDPERHMHATHNALAVSDKYAWSYGELSEFLTMSPTPLMREYWQANIDAHDPQDLDWVPVPKWDMTDYAAHNAEMAKNDAVFWKDAAKGGWQVAVSLPEYWHFYFDDEQRLRHNPWTGERFDHRAWPLLDVRKCWQSQTVKAHGIGIYRMKFDAPANLDPANQEIVLGFGSFPPDNPAKTGWMDISLNGKGYRMGHLIDVTKSIRPGQTNVVAVRVFNKSGPAGLTGQVKLLARGGAIAVGAGTADGTTGTMIFSEDFEQYADGTMLTAAGWKSVRHDMKITMNTSLGGTNKAVDGKTPTGDEALVHKNFTGSVNAGDALTLAAKVYHAYGGSAAGVGMSRQDGKQLLISNNGWQWYLYADALGVEQPITFWPWSNADPWARPLTARIHVDSKAHSVWATLTDARGTVHSSDKIRFKPGAETKLNGVCIYMKDSVDRRNMHIDDIKVERTSPP